VDLRAQLAGLLVALGVTALVVVRAATAPAPPPLKHASAADRDGFAASVASQEDDWRGKAARDFPSDLWSQRDAFHGHEAQAVRDLAGLSGVPYEDVFRAIDDDLHHAASPERVRPNARRPADRNVNAVPVKPRPIFD
jgi:hypothetical protein